MRRSRQVLGWLVVALSTAWPPTGSAQTTGDGPPGEVSAATFERWMDELSNWGRWGPADELGTLNLITPAARLRAARLVTEGVAVSLGTNGAASPYQNQLTLSRYGGHHVALDTYQVQSHGFGHSHLDALAHYAHSGQLYNGFPVAGLRDEGSEHLGIQNMAQGIFSRGVLVDAPWLLGVDYLEPGVAVTPEHLAEWERRTGIVIGEGDVVLLRTGRWVLSRRTGDWDIGEEVAGLHASAAKWLRSRDAAVLGSDAVGDVHPSGVEGLVNPLHELLLAGLGMPILDNLDLDTLSAEARRRDRWIFLFVGTPLTVPGGTGAPLNPLAIF